MPFETIDQSESQMTSASGSLDSKLIDVDWDRVFDRVSQSAKRNAIGDLFGPSAAGGSAYRWGVAVATGQACTESFQCLTALSCGEKLGKKRLDRFDFDREIRSFLNRVAGARQIAPVDATMSVAWAAALPSLVNRVDHGTWLALLSCLLDLHDSVLERGDLSSPQYLIIGGELGLTLATSLKPVPACKGMRKSSAQAVARWCEAETESVSRALVGSVDARLVIASMIRSKWLLSGTAGGRSIKKTSRETGQSLATWIAAMTTHGGCHAFSKAKRADVADDCVADGLLQQVSKFDAESLKPAIDAAMGAIQTGGRLAWQVCLPEAMHHDEDAKVATLFPDWDVRRGRMHVDYGGREMQLELFAGRSKLVSGGWETQIEINGHPQQACGDWEEVCEYTDDDVHYLEIEQAWTGGILLQRQIMLLRDDRAVLFADAVLPSAKDSPDRSIRYTCRLPLAEEVSAEPEQETRELILTVGKKRGLVIPLAASEWRVGATPSTLTLTDDRHLALMMQGENRLYAPVWIDLQQRRFRRKRTWRQLTVADQLRIVDLEEAVGYRIQQGSEQWLVYRSLSDSRSRTILGKHLIADFYCSRFDAGDGSHEELITVDDSQADDD